DDCDLRRTESFPRAEREQLAIRRRELCQRGPHRLAPWIGRSGERLARENAQLRLESGREQGRRPLAPVVVAEDAAGDAEEPEAGLISAGELSHSPPRNEVDLRQEVGGVLWSLRPSGEIAEDRNSGLPIDLLEPGTICGDVVAGAPHLPAQGRGCPTQLTRYQPL